MSTRQSLKLVAIILVLLSAAAAIMPAYAQEAPNLPSILTLDPVAVQPIGTPITVMAHLTDSHGGANPNKVLNLYLDDVLVRRTRTDDKGAASIRIGNDLTAGKYALRIEFQGTQAYLPSSISTNLIVRPAELTVSIIPPLANIPFSLNGQKFMSDDKGVARLAVYKVGDFPLDVLLDADTEVSPDTRVTFDRWQDEYQPRRTVTINGDVSIEAGFNVSHPVSQAFVDLSNNPVDMSRIETLTLQGTDGSKFTFDDGSERWLRAGRIARRQTGLEATQIMYSVESVMINGSNTVNRYQQRFFVKPNSVWPIQLLLYHATFRAEDAVFGFHIGKGINVKYPDGHVEYMPFGTDNQISIGPVPRGVYKVQVIGASGMAPETPLALSRNQELDLKVLSSLNIGLALGLGVFGVFGLVLYGRPYLPRLAFRTTRNIATVRWVHFTLAQNQSRGLSPLSKRMHDRTNLKYNPLRFLRSNARKPAQITARVQYLLPESSIISSEQPAKQPAQWSISEELALVNKVERAVIEMAIAEPLYGRRRVSQELEKIGIFISPANVRAIQMQYNLETVENRLSGVYTQLSKNPQQLSADSVPAVLEEKPQAIDSNGELNQDSHHTGIMVQLFVNGRGTPRPHKIYAIFDPFLHKYPGYLGAQDTYYVGSIDGIGDVYQQTYIDVYSGVALVKVYDRKDSEVAVDMLNTIVQPWFEHHKVHIENVITDRGREYVKTGQQKNQYQDFLAASGIYHTINGSNDPQSNNFCTPFHHMIRKEVYNKVLSKHTKQSVSLAVLQQAVDDWLNWYNSERPCDGQNQGETPLDRLHSQPFSESTNGRHASEAGYAGQEESESLFT